jgi:hypothetical protein
MDTPWFSAAMQVGLGGVLVLITGVPIGSSSESLGCGRRSKLVLYGRLPVIIQRFFYGRVSSGCCPFS